MTLAEAAEIREKKYEELEKEIKNKKFKGNKDQLIHEIEVEYCANTKQIVSDLIHHHK